MLDVARVYRVATKKYGQMPTGKRSNVYCFSQGFAFPVRPTLFCLIKTSTCKHIQEQALEYLVCVSGGGDFW